MPADGLPVGWHHPHRDLCPTRPKEADHEQECAARSADTRWAINWERHTFRQRPVLTRRAAIAEQLRALVELAGSQPLILAVTDDSNIQECSLFALQSNGYDEADDYDELVYDAVDQSLVHEPQPERLGWWVTPFSFLEAQAPEEIDWSTRPHPQDFSAPHLRECLDCAYADAVLNAPLDVTIPDDRDVQATQDDWAWTDTAFLPLMTYGQAITELGEWFIVTGPNVVWPESTRENYLRVYELARVADLPCQAVIGLLRLYDEYVTSHLSYVARPAARDFLAALSIHGDLDVLIAQTRPLSIHERIGQAIA